MSPDLWRSRTGARIHGWPIALAALLAAGIAAASPASSPPGRSPSHPKQAVRLDPAPAGSATAGAGDDAVPGTDALRQGEKAVVGKDGALALRLRVPPGGLTDEWLRGYLPDDRAVADFRKSLGSPPPAAGGSVTVPLAQLSSEPRVRLLGALFPGSGPRGGDWVHRVGAGRMPPQQETLDRIASWYTGRSANGRALAESNGIGAEGPRPGQEIIIPRALLLSAFARRAATPGPAPASDPTRPSEDDFTEAPVAGEEEEGPSIGSPGPYAPPPVAEGAEDLEYGRDAEGRYAVYRLKKGEALYSAVVVRFTGRIDVQEVNDLAAQIARRSGIDDVTNIAIGYKVRIPLDDLLPEYQPRDDPRRRAWERNHAQVARYTNAARSRDLQGVAIILDAGHGGRDIGASHNGVWEHDYVYDILCRVKAVLEKRTRARVLPTIRDRKEGWTIHESQRLARNRAEVLLTDPPFRLSDSVSSVNLRWYLSNAWYRKLVEEGFDPFKVVFTSLHADARHPSLAGAMVYVPGEEYRRGRYGSSGERYARYREAREEPFVSFTRDERERSEGLSRQFAATVIESFRDRGVNLQAFEPVRERIIRRGRAWVPAVLRCNAVPVEILIEVSNLSNPADARAIKDPAYRQRIAEAYVEALVRYFTVPASGSAAGPATVPSARPEPGRR